MFFHLKGCFLSRNTSICCLDCLNLLVTFLLFFYLLTQVEAVRVCLKSVKKIIPNVVEVISSSGYIFPGVVKKGGVFFLASIVNTSLFFFCLGK